MSEHGTMREEMNKDSIRAIQRGRANIGKNGIRKAEPCNPSRPMAYFQSRNFDKVCGNPLLLAFISREVVKGTTKVNDKRFVSVKRIAG